MAQSTAVERRQAGPVTMMFSHQSQFAAVLPKSVDVESFLGTMAGALYANKELMAAAIQNPDSLYTALMRCAALGHQPGTDEYYLTPRKGKVVGIEGYRGIIERMYRSGAVKKVIVREVCAKDRFKFVEGEMDRPQHAVGGGDPYDSRSTGEDFFGKDGKRNRGQMVGVYAYAELITGAISRVVLLSRDDIMAVRDASDSAGSDYSPWNRMDGGKDHPEFKGRSMWWKTAARRLEPWVPTSAEYRREMMRAVTAAQEVGGVSVAQAQVDELVVDGEIVETLPDAPLASSGAENVAGTGGDGPAPATATSLAGALKSSLAGAADNRPATSAQKSNLAIWMKEFGDPEDQQALLSWLRGKEQDEPVTRGDCVIVATYLDRKTAEVSEDPGQDLVSIVWADYKQAHGAD